MFGCFTVNRTDTVFPAGNVCSVDSQRNKECVCCVFKNRKANELCFAGRPVCPIRADAVCERITAALLKSRTGEFDLESILFLKLRGLGKI